MANEKYVAMLCPSSEIISIKFTAWIIHTINVSVSEHTKKKTVTSLKRLLNIVFFIEFKSLKTYIAFSRIDCIKIYDSRYLLEK